MTTYKANLKTVMIGVKMSPNLKSDLDDYCWRHRKGKSEFIREMIQERIKNEEKTKHR